MNEKPWGLGPITSGKRLSAFLADFYSVGPQSYLLFSYITPEKGLNPNAERDFFDF